MHAVVHRCSYRVLVIVHIEPRKAVVTRLEHSNDKEREGKVENAVNANPLSNPNTHIVTPTTATSAMAACSSSKASNSAGATWFPFTLINSCRKFEHN